jgi:hypothetical protein
MAAVPRSRGREDIVNVTDYVTDILLILVNFRQMRPHEPVLA